MIVLTIIDYHVQTVHDSSWWFVEIAQCARVASEDLFRYRSNSFPDIKFQSSIISSYIPIAVVIAKNLPQTWLGLVHIYYVAYQTTTPLLVAWLFRFFAFLTFSLSASLLSEYSSKLLLCCCCSSSSWARFGYSRWPKNYRAHPLGQTDKTIMNYHVEFEHVQTAW